MIRDSITRCSLQRAQELFDLKERQVINIVCGNQPHDFL